MQSENRIVKELVNFVREQRQINREQMGINERMEGYVREQRAINRQQQNISEKIERFMAESERRFRTFYAPITAQGR